MTTMLFISFAVLGLAAMYNMWLFDRLVEWEYKNHREQWERDGKPTGCLFWHPSEPKGLSSGRVEQCLNCKWMFKMPSWATTSLECRRWIAYKRVSTLIASLVVLALLLKLL